MNIKATRVVVGFAESLSAIESVWELLDAGFDVVAFTRRGTRPALRHVPGVTIVPVTSPADDAPRACEDLVRAVSDCGASAVLPLDDDSLWLCARAVLDPRWTAALAGPSGALAHLAIDKERQLVLARGAGLAVPLTTVVTPEVESWELPGTGPFVVKPSLAVVELDGRLRRFVGTRTHCQEGVQQAMRDWRSPALVQPLLRGVGEGVFGFATEDGVIGWSGHRRLRMMNPAGSGSSACRSIDPDPVLVQACARLVASAGWRGLFMVELLRAPDGTAWFMELNGRSWGSMALARRRGLPYAVWAVRAVLDPATPPVDVAPGPHLTCRHVGRELVHLALVTRRPEGVGASDWPSWPEAARSVLRWTSDERAYNLRRGSGRVFMSDTWSTLRQRLPDLPHALRRGSASSARRVGA